jgi:hypothetical protein
MDDRDRRISNFSYQNYWFISFPRLPLSQGKSIADSILLEDMIPGGDFILQLPMTKCPWWNFTGFSDNCWFIWSCLVRADCLTWFGSKRYFMNKTIVIVLMCIYSTIFVTQTHRDGRRGCSNPKSNPSRTLENPKTRGLFPENRLSRLMRIPRRFHSPKPLALLNLICNTEICWIRRSSVKAGAVICDTITLSCFLDGRAT